MMTSQIGTMLPRPAALPWAGAARILLAMLAVSCAAPAIAAPPAPAAGPSAADAASTPEALAAARALMEASDIKGQLKAVGPSLAKASEEQTRRMFTDAKMPAGLQTRMSHVLGTYLGSLDSVFTPAVMDAMATVYARHFSIADLNRLTAMMRDPVMVQFRQRTPAVMAELTPVLMEAMRPQQDALRKQLFDVIADWMREHPNDKATLKTPLAS